MYFFWCFISLGVIHGASPQNMTDPTWVIAEEFIVDPVMRNLLMYGSPDMPSLNVSDVETQHSANVTEAEYALQKLIGLTDDDLAIDVDLLKAINYPKCSCYLDRNSTTPESYSTAPSKWKKHRLTYRITLFSQWMDAETVRRIIRDSFKLWSDVTPLTFSEVDASEEADMTVKFQGGQHGDPWPFEGRGGVLAHAFYPTGGQCHFDDDEYWGAPDSGGFSLFQTAVHEIGHMLGLRHSDVPQAVMAPYYKFGSQYRVPVLSDDDISGIQSLYGAPVPSTPPPPPEDACTGGIDAAIYHKEIEKDVLFTGEYMWTVDDSSADVTDIQSSFQFLTSDVTAAIYLPANRKTYLFKECYVYVYNKDLVFVRRRMNSHIFRGLPCNIDSGFYSGADRITYFFKGSWVYAYQGFIFYGRIRIAGLRWPNMPLELEGGIEAVYDTNSNSDAVYFIKGNNYYVMDRQSKLFSGERHSVRENLLRRCP